MQWNRNNQRSDLLPLSARDLRRGISSEQTPLSSTIGLTRRMAQCSMTFLCCWGLAPAGSIPNAANPLTVTRSRTRWCARPRNGPCRTTLRCAVGFDHALPHAAGDAMVEPESRSAILGALSMPNRQERSDSIRRVIMDLESMPNARPGTAEFCAFALCGDWELLFSSSPSSGPSRIRVLRTIRSFDALRKTVMNTCYWALSGEGTAHEADAVLEISGTYSFSNGGPLFDVQVQSHEIRLLKNENGRSNAVLPDDLQPVIMDLRRSLPVEFFDPSGTVEITHLDPNFRISCMVGSRLFGVRNVYQRYRRPKL